MMIKKLFFNLMILAAFLPVPLSAQGKETLAVLDFTTEAVSETEMSAIVEYLSAELFNTNMFIVIDVSQRETILQEMEFSLQGCSDDTCALEIGKMLSAEMIVVGNLSKVGSRYLVTAKMLQTETSRTMGTANGKYNNLDELIDGLEVLAVKLAEGAGDIVVAAPEPKIVEATTEPVVAVPEIVEATPEPAVEAVEISKPAESPAEVARSAAAEKAATKDKPAGNTLVPAIACTAGGVAALGVGGYFLFQLFSNSLPAYETTTDAYSAALSGDDFNALWDNRLGAYDEMALDFWIGVPTAAVGAALITVGVILFTSTKDEGTAVSFAPVISDNPGLIVRVSY